MSLFKFRINSFKIMMEINVKNKRPISNKKLLNQYKDIKLAYNMLIYHYKINLQELKIFWNIIKNINKKSAINLN